jgi:LmbE family N-acetylglucosaminyl deacetylase
MPDAPTRVLFRELEREGIEPYEVPNLYLSVEEPDTFVDITDTLPTKIKALLAHESQLGPEVEDSVTTRARELGERAGVEFAEGFRAFRLADDDEADD